MGAFRRGRAAAFLGWAVLLYAHAQNASRATSSIVEGVVADPAGARVQHAAVHASGVAGESASPGMEAETDANGHFRLQLPPGAWQITVDAPGFREAEQETSDLRRGERLELDFALAIATTVEELTVPADPGHTSLSGGDNGNALSFDSKQLDTFSEDDATFQKQLLALAGADGVHLPDILVDGFSDGRIPPKNQIRQIRINRNPYAAMYDTFGVTRLEVFTKPGSQTLHGDLSASGTNQPLDAQNPYTGYEPPWYALQLAGDVSGPLGRKTTAALSGFSYNFQNNAVVNAIDPTSLATLSQAVPAPQTVRDGALRLDREITPAHTLIARYEWNQTAQTNAGAGLLVLPSEGYDSTSTTQTLQLSTTSIFSPKLVAETRFQYLRTRVDQTPVSTAPTVIVEGSFNGGGAPTQQLNEHQDRFELQQMISLDRGTHFVRLGGRYRMARDASFSDANYNGQYLFANLAAYKAAKASSGAGATQFSLTTGQPNASVFTGDLALFAEDEWKAAKSLTFNYGLRFESQTAIPDHGDWAPRLGFGWAVGRLANKAPLVTIRGGFGIFYTRFDAADLLTSVRQNGVSQQSYYVEDPQFFSASTIPGNADLRATARQPTIYRVAPNLHAAYEIDESLLAEHAFSRVAYLAVSYNHSLEPRQYLSLNVNAPLPGTYTPDVPGSGTRPYGDSGNLYQFSSQGSMTLDSFTVNARVNARRISAYTLLTLNRARGDSAGASSFPSEQYNVRSDEGRLSTVSGEALYVGGTARLPCGFTSTAFFSVTSGRPFDITVGQDLNGDTAFNDRPSFATDLTRASVVRTRYGNFDRAPTAGQTIIPHNFGNGPGYLGLQLTLHRDIAVGPRPAAAAIAAGKPAPARLDRPWLLSLGLEANNLTNTNNPGPPVGVLESPLFGKSISLNNVFTANQAANRTLQLTSRFSF